MIVKNYVTLHEYMRGNLKADVIRSLGEKKEYGIRMYQDDACLGIEWYPGHSESYAEDSAENYVEGIKKYVRDDGLE